MAHDVFISHSARDKEVADAICHRMEDAGIRCWIAPRDVQTGQAWDDAIVEALAATKLVVLVFSAAANQSRPVRNEIAAALDADKIVFPFRIENILPSGGLQFHLSRVHWLDAMSPPLDAHIDNLVASAKRQLGTAAPDLPPPPILTPTPAPPRSPVVATPPPRNTAGMLIGAVGGVALLLAGGLAAYVWMQKREPLPVRPLPETTTALNRVPAPPAAQPAAPPPAAPPPPAAEPVAPGAGAPAPAPPASASPSRSGDFTVPGSDSRLLSAGDLAGLSCNQLEIARNEIFARRGRYFQRADLQNYFAKFAWYHPTTWNPELNPAEQANVALISGTESRNHCR